MIVSNFSSMDQYPQQRASISRVFDKFSRLVPVGFPNSRLNAVVSRADDDQSCIVHQLSPSTTNDPADIQIPEGPSGPVPGEASEVEAVYSVIHDGLRELSCMTRRTSSSSDSKRSSLSKPPNSLRIKLEYRGEKYCIEFPRPVIFRDLERHLAKKFARQLNMYYTLSNSELVVPLRNQQELDRAIELLEKSHGHRSLRLLLSSHQSNSGFSPTPDLPVPGTSYLTPDASGTYSKSPSKIVEVEYAESRSSRTNSGSYRNSSSTGSRACSGCDSSASSGIALLDNDGDEGRFDSAPKPPSNWKLGKRIGSGAFGEVFICYDVDTGRQIAMKRLIFVRDDSHLKKQAIQLENEINLLSTIHHKRIVQYLGAQRTEQSISIFMEYMAGGSVKELIIELGALSSAVARKYISQVIEGLAYLHRNDMIHRDIKPANILRDTDGNVKIGDFGSAKRLQTICSQQSASFVGTPNYMAPEVVVGRTSYGRKADMWSVGCSLLEMLTGKPPWYGMEPITVIFSIAYQNPTYELPKDVDPYLVNLLEALLERDPSKRPSSTELFKSRPTLNRM
ncbi:hypothetical protein AB6A40_004603 [Gnathostoma spinigerum]|uniref:Protein kinase domain-containing protein n=1 Tax=Gnathostoma spinigerum TaxID=75299 RepID=A0ABD6ECZ1_9BILA